MIRGLALLRSSLQRHCISGTKRNAEKPVVMANHQPPWTLPARQTDEPVLRIYNSLTRNKVRAFFTQYIPGLTMRTD